MNSYSLLSLYHGKHRAQGIQRETRTLSAGSTSVPLWGGKRVPTVRPLSFRIYRRCPLQHQNGTVTRISEPVSTSYYRTNCTIQLQLASGKLIARASTDSQYNKSAYPAAVLSKVEMEIPITGTSVGGFGILYNGGAPTVITDLKVEWP